MKALVRRVALSALALFGLSMMSAPAAAQATRTWISGVGDDANPCSRTAPCKTFGGAISKTAAGGEINCIDPGGFGALTITKSISIICDEVEAGVTAYGVNGFIVNGNNIYVTISGIDLDGLGNTGSGSGVNGINVLNAAAVSINNSKIRGFRNGYGIRIAPSAGAVQVSVLNTVLSENGGTANPTNSGGILVNPQGTATAKVTLENVTIFDNTNVGMKVDTTGNTAAGNGMVVMVGNTRITSNGAGISVINPPSTSRAQLALSSSIINYNDGYGIGANGSFAQMRVDNSTIKGNGTGVLTANGGVALSYGNNRVFGNATDGSFTSILPQQ